MFRKRRPTTRAGITRLPLQTPKDVTTLRTYKPVRRQLTRNPLRRIDVLAPVLVLSLLVTGCAGAADDGAGGGDSDTLVLVTGGASANQMAPYLAELLGYAEEEGLSLSVNSVDANVLNIVVGGQADVGEIGSGTALVPVKDGKDTAIIYGVGPGAGSGFMAGTDGIETFADCTRVATHKAGSAAYSAAAAYKKATNAGYEILEYGAPGDVVASVLAGHNDCAVSSSGILTPGLEKGLHLIIDPEDPATIPPNSVQGAVGVGLWGMKDNLEHKRSAVVKLMKAMVKVEAYLKKTDPEEVAKVLVTHSDFETNDVSQLARNVAAETGLMFPNSGEILEQEWPSTLSFYSWGLPFVDPDDSLWSFENRVDMSYLSSATSD
jgi:ABC-type nitrate/sulfonate/bicarbonate transport system substrate-binding protein